LTKLRDEQRQAVKARARAEIEREEAQQRAREAEQEAKVRRQAERVRLQAIERTGRDPQTGDIADLTKVPDDELSMLDAEAEGLSPDEVTAEMERRAREAERAAALEENRGPRLLDVLGSKVRLPTSDPQLSGELRTLITENMTPPQRARFTSRHSRSLDQVAEKLREEGFSWIQTPADVIDSVERALRGED